MAVQSLGESITHVFPCAPRPLATTGNKCLNFHNICSLLKPASPALANNGRDLIWSKFSPYSQLGQGSIRSLLTILLRLFFPCLFSWEPFHMCRAFLTFSGHQKSIRVRETKILMDHQYVRLHQQSIQFYSERE